MRKRSMVAALCLAGVAWGGVVEAQMFSVTFLHTPPSKAIAGQELVITGNMVGADQVSIAALAYRLPGQEEFEVRELKLISSDQYRGTIPAKDLRPPAIEYYCYAVDFEGNRHTVFASEQQPQRVSVVTRSSVTGPRTDPKSGPKTGPKPDAGKAGDPSAAKPADSSAGPGAAAADGPMPEWPVDTIALATFSQEPIARAPAIVSMVGRAQIEGMGARTLADILDQLPGMSIARSVSGEYQIAMRGVQSDPEVLVLLDGHRINDLYSGTALLEFPAEGIERVEVLRGPGSALYGTGAFMGVINIVSRSGSDPHASAAYGLYNEVRASAGGGWASDAFAIGGQVQFVRSDGQDRAVERDVLTGVAGTTETASDDVSNTPGPVDDRRMLVHAQFESALKQLAKGELKLLGHYLYQSRGAYVGKFNSLDSGSDLSLHLVNLDLDYRLPLGDMVELDVLAYFDLHKVDRAFQVIRAPEDVFGNSYVAGDMILNQGLRETDSYQGMTVGAEFSTGVQLLKTNRLVAGVQFEYLSLPKFTQQRDTGGVTCTPCAASAQGCVLIQGYELPCGSIEGAQAGKDRIMVGVYVQDQWKDLLVNGLDLLAGVRFDYFTDFGYNFNPRVALVYGPLEALRFKVLYAQSFRAPTFQELYDDARFDPIRTFQGNGDLSPVKINTLEVGLEGQIQTRPVDYRLRANFFVNWIEDSIESVDQGTGLATWDNVESLQVIGTEVEGVARFGKRNRVFANGSWFRAEVQVQGQDAPSYITDVPQMRLNLGMDLAVFEFLNLHFGLRYGSERRNNVRQRLELLRSFRIPTYTLVRVGLSTEPLLFDHLVFFAHAYNIFGQDHRDPAPRPDHLTGGLPREPFTFMVGIGWRP
jgi:outer membrane cobalamin receptor